MKRRSPMVVHNVQVFINHEKHSTHQCRDQSRTRQEHPTQLRAPLETRRYERHASVTQAVSLSVSHATRASRVAQQSLQASIEGSTDFGWPIGKWKDLHTTKFRARDWARQRDHLRKSLSKNHYYTYTQVYISGRGDDEEELMVFMTSEYVYH
jgi:hypothetical protein